MTLFDRFSKAAKISFYGTPAEYELGGKVIRCNHCGHTRFTRNRPLKTVFAIAVFRFVTALECENCGMILWFSEAPRMREQENQ